MNYPPSISFGENGVHPALSASANLTYHELDAGTPDGHPKRLSRVSRSPPIEESQLSLSPRDTQPWSFEVLQWERQADSRGKGASSSPRVSPFSTLAQLVDADARPPPGLEPRWVPFRIVKWNPTDQKVSIRTGRGARPAGGGRYVFDQVPGSGGLVGRAPSSSSFANANRGQSNRVTREDRLGAREDTASSRNAVSASAVARMGAMASPNHYSDSEGEDSVDSVGASAHYSHRLSPRDRMSFYTGKGAERSFPANGASNLSQVKPRAIQFQLGDLRAVQRYCFSHPLTVELTSDCNEYSDERRTDPIAYRFCLFGPVGVIIRLSGGFEVFLVFRNVSEAEEVHNFLQRALERRHPSAKIASDDGPGTSQPLGNASKTRSDKSKRGTSTKGGRKLRVGSPKKKEAPPSPRADASTSRIEGSSLYDQSTLNTSANTTTTNSSRMRHLRIPEDASIHVRPFLATTNGITGSHEGVDRKPRRLFMKPSRITRRYMRGIPSTHLSQQVSDPTASSTFTTRQGNRGAPGRSPGGTVSIDNKERTLNVHLTCSKTLWWQRMKHKLSAHAPASLTVNLLTSRMVNLSRQGRSLAWHFELPSDYPMPLDKSLARMVGPLAQGPSDTQSGDVAWHGVWEVTLPSPAIKEAWLRFFDLIGARVDWSGHERAYVDPTPTSLAENYSQRHSSQAKVSEEADVFSPAEGRESHTSLGEPQTPEDIPRTALPSSDSEAGTEDGDTTEPPPPEPITHTRIHREMLTPLASSALPSDVDASAAPALPLQEATSRLGTVAAPPTASAPEEDSSSASDRSPQTTTSPDNSSGNTETVPVDVSASSSSSDARTSSPPPPAPATPPPPPVEAPPTRVEDGIPRSLSGWRSILQRDRSSDSPSTDPTPLKPSDASPTSQNTTVLPSPVIRPPGELPPWRQALIASSAVHDPSSRDESLVAPQGTPNPTAKELQWPDEAGHHEPSEDEQGFLESSGDSSLASMYCSPDVFENNPAHQEESPLHPRSIASHAMTASSPPPRRQPPPGADIKGPPRERSHTQPPFSPSSSDTPVISPTSPPDSPRTPADVAVLTGRKEHQRASPLDASSPLTDRTPTGLRGFIESSPTTRTAAEALAHQLFPPQRGRISVLGITRDSSGDSIPPPPSSEMSSDGRSNDGASLLLPYARSMDNRSFVNRSFVSTGSRTSTVDA